MSDSLTVYLSGDAWKGNAEATISVNGVQVGGVLSVAAVNAANQVQAFTFTGNFGATPTVSVSFINDAYGGTAAMDRNLYLYGFNYDGVMQLSDQAPLLYNQTLSYTLTSTPATAIRASDFIDSLGVNVHLQDTADSYANTSLVQADLSYLGIDNVRDGIPTATSLAAMQTLAAAGFQFDLIMPSVSSTSLLPQQIAAINQIASSVMAIEGPNEVNSQAVSWNHASGVAATDAYQKALWKAVQADALLDQDPVYAFSLANTTSALVASYGNLSAYSDDGNLHVYYGSNATPLQSLLYNVGMAAASNSSDPLVVTETGYASSTAPGGVTQDVQARYDLDILMDATKLGIANTFLYELFDDAPDPSNTVLQDHLGLFNSDGTPKLAATAIHNLTSLLADPGTNATTFTPGSLNYTVTGLPAAADTLLLEKSSGVYDLIVWAEPNLWDDTTTVTTQPSLVQVALGFMAASVSVYDPLSGTSAIAQYSDVSSITVAITDHPIIIEITPGTGLMTSNGAAGSAGNAGQSVTATATAPNLTTTTATATGGAGGAGISASPDGGAGGSAAATASTTIWSATSSATATATATAVGGAGGAGYRSGSAGPGGSAQAAAASSTTGTHATASATAIATGGAGGGSVTGATATATGAIAGAVVTATGGAGNAANSGTEGAGGTVTGSSASAAGISSASARITQRGGSGGAGGGAGASSVLTNAVTGSTKGGALTLVQDAIGGNGGATDGGTGGSAGSATSSLTFDDTKNVAASRSLTVYVDAYGGTGGSGSTGGIGGSGTASDTIITTGNATVTTLASGGPGGDAGGGASAVSSVAGAAVTATATAVAGMSQTLAETADAYQQANGTSGSITAAASTFTQDRIFNEAASATAAVRGNASALASTSMGGSISWQPENAEAILNASPSSATITSVLAGAINTNSVFSSGATFLAVGELGGSHSSVGTTAQTDTTSIDLSFSRSQLSESDLFLSFYKAAVTGSGGITDVNVSISANGTNLLTGDFSSAASATSWFSDHPIDLGSLASGGLTTSSIVTLQVGLSVTSNTAGSGFHTGLILGAVPSSSLWPMT